MKFCNRCGGKIGHSYLSKAYPSRNGKFLVEVVVHYIGTECWERSQS